MRLGGSFGRPAVLRPSLQDAADSCRSCHAEMTRNVVDDGERFCADNSLNGKPSL